MGVQISEAANTSPELVQAMARLVPQLSSTAPPPTAEEIGAIIESPATILLVATDDETGEIVGTLTLCVFRIPTGVRAWIEDVITDDTARGRGVGEALSRFAVDRAAELGAVSVDLTSRPSREAANRLYQRIGFEPRETNVYRKVLGADSS